MANEEHLKILKQGVDVWNQWNEDNLGFIADLSKADLRGVDLKGADLIAADLQRGKPQRG